MEAQGWTVVYVRREEDKSGGLPALLAAKLVELADAAEEKLIILDQVEEILTNPIIHLPDEVPALIDSIVNALEDDPSLRIILGFRSEYATHLKRELDQHVERPEYDAGNTVYTLGRPGLVEAIRSVSVDHSLNGPGKPYRLRFRPSSTLPGTIADHLLDSKAGSHIAPLLQVNLELLWQRCRRDDGVVEITGQEIHDIIDTHEALLNHYVEMIRREVSASQVDDQRLFELLHYYVEQKPASALRLDQEFEQKFGNDTFAALLREQCKRLYLLYSKGSGQDAITRLSHDSLAEVIDGRYSQLTQAKVASRGSLAFDSLRREIDEQISSLRFREALDTLDQLMTVEERRQELYPYLFELCFFWNEAGGQEETKRILSHWIDSGLLADQLDLVTRLSTDPDVQQIRGWLGAVDPPRYRDLQSRYLAPEQTVMVPIVGGKFLMGDETGDLWEACRPVHPVRLDAFRLANVPVTWWQFGLYLFAIQQEQQLESKGGSGGVQGNHPVVSVSWYEAVAYCNWLSEHVGLESAYVIDRDQSDPNNLNEEDNQKWTVRVVDGVAGYRLPSEAEWEYACRAATTTRYSFGDQEDQLSEYAWFEDNSDSHAHPVGAKKPNAWGLYDMHGNVWEWCQDWFGESYYEEMVDSNPKGPDRGSNRVYRGGSWNFDARDCRSAYRPGDDPGNRNGYLGFRLARRSVVSSTSGLARILVVDDSLTQLAQMKMILEAEAEYEVVTATDGLDALEKIQVARPDLIVTDLQMPNMNGLELVEATQRDFPELPVVLVTAQGSEGIAAEAIRKGAASYIPKRDMRTWLVPTVRQLLSERL